MKAGRFQFDRREQFTSRFVRLDHSLLSSPAYRALSPNARSLLVELAMMENGKNNGTGLFLSVRDAADRMGLADLHAASRAFDELEALGFIACTAEAHFAVKAGPGSRSRFWRLTWLAVNRQQGPSMEFLSSHPDQAQEPYSEHQALYAAAQRRLRAGCAALKRWTKVLCSNDLPVVDFATRMPKRVADSTTHPVASKPVQDFCVADSTTHFGKNGGNPPFPVVVESPTYTADQLVGTEGPDQEALRTSTLAFIKTGGRGTRGRLAATAGIAELKLSAFLDDRVELPVASAARLARELNRSASEAA